MHILRRVHTDDPSDRKEMLILAIPTSQGMKYQVKLIRALGETECNDLETAERWFEAFMERARKAHNTIFYEQKFEEGYL